MTTHYKTLTVGFVLVAAAMAGCSATTTGSSGAVQDDAMTAAASGAALASADPAATTAVSPAPASPVATPADTPNASASPPLLGSSSNGPCDNGMQYSCGDTGPAGGLIVYVIKDGFALSNGYSAACSTNCNYLEAQPSALSSGYPWCVGPGATAILSPGTGGAIGTGYSNTQTMATFSSYCSSGAASAALASTVGGYTDWFVPSQSELDALATNWNWPNHGNTPNYWTSSQTGTKGYAWSGSVGGGAGCCHDNTPVSYDYSVWPMRAF
jgi:hypothetical protein